MTNKSDLVITNERTADDDYRNALRKEELERVPVHHGRLVPPRTPHVPTPSSRGLIGRVALAEETDFFGGTTFYIGSRPHEGSGLVVFSWAAPLAATFFGGPGSHELCSRVIATRTLLRRGERVVDYVDDDGPVPHSGKPFPARSLSIPRARTQHPLPGRAGPAARVPGQRQPVDRDTADAGTGRPHERAHPPAVEQLRAGRAVLGALTAPRRERLTSVLATLQADQYDLVTADPHQVLMIEGHPGTGKTVVAAHRAAYLVHRANERRSRRVLVVGPTEQYARHVTGALNELVDEPGTVDAMSLDDLMQDVRGVSADLDEGRPAHFRDVDPELGELAEYANLLRTEGRLGPRSAHAAGVEQVYEALRKNSVGTRRVDREGEWTAYLRALPPFRTARSMRRYLPLLAACGAAVAAGGPYTYDHMIVDEAQDVTALEWAVLRTMNPNNRWTLLGDMNQRRSDLSFRDWSQIADVLDEQAPDLRVLRRGYRTTAAIMQFAGRLLPRSERRAHSLQTAGATPRVVRARAEDLHARVADEASGLLDQHPDGTVAVLAMTPRESLRALRRSGFVVDPHDPDTMLRSGRRIRVLDPQKARGLEFDAVIVVEPSAFPPRLEGHGLLYTSLTRANRELVVVHSAPLPDALRVRPTRLRSVPMSL